MSGPAQAPETPITDFSQLVAYIAEGCKPKQDWRIGTEHEKLAYTAHDFRPMPYDGPTGIGRLLQELQRFGWQPVQENGKTIALLLDNQSITLEPGGQFELSGAPLETIHQTCIEVSTHLKQVRQVGEEMGIAMAGLGMQPKWRRADIPMMPKGRYKIMTEYMPKKGNLGLDMMYRTCTVQVNLDFSSEADMVQKFRTGLALQPLATALFANSPFTEGKPNGFLSFRSHIWTDTDPDRSGMLPFVFEDGMGFERYARHALDVPMYFVYKDGQYIDASGQSFRDFMAGKLPALPGELPTLRHWADHLTTLFPEVRMKRFLEMRGADGGPWSRLCALPALWVGLLYDQSALDAAWDLCKDWTHEERAMLRVDAPKYGLHTPFRGGTLQNVAREMVKIAQAGLRARNRVSPAGEDETHFLEPLQAIAESGETPAEALLKLYNGRWNRSVDPVFTELAY
ncbi:glutamate--cysteine ligase [Ferrovibrio sp.]|uniref:glutamate--cysteine ligase n=1 Tax=Ferrovibrio sp. TaxID=1917215 RepID=UPI001B62732E|nr:glutamate--cysteine ligase [Ferrovibrio sp.]MBP7065627.1 glutamate--cysteine ligase [Ferrovibrio sp.]